MLKCLIFYTHLRRDFLREFYFYAMNSVAVNISQRIYVPESGHMVFRHLPTVVDEINIFRVISTFGHVLGISVDRYNITGESKGSEK